MNHFLYLDKPVLIEMDQNQLMVHTDSALLDRDDALIHYTRHILNFNTISRPGQGQIKTYTFTKYDSSQHLTFVLMIN